MTTYNFQRYVPVLPVRRNPTPKFMDLGEIVVRENVNRSGIAALKCLMRSAMRKQGMEFSIDATPPNFVIRRDK